MISDLLINDNCKVKVMNISYDKERIILFSTGRSGYSKRNSGDKVLGIEINVINELVVNVISLMHS